MSVSNRSTTKTVLVATLVLVVTFAAGFVTGAAADRWMMHRRGPHRPPRFVPHLMLHRLDRHLDLDQRQETEIRRILERRHQRIAAQWEVMRPRIDAEIQQTNSEIERLLTPAQREKFQDLRLRLGPHMHRGGKGRKEPTR